MFVFVLHLFDLIIITLAVLSMSSLIIVTMVAFVAWLATKLVAAVQKLVLLKISVMFWIDRKSSF